MALKELLVTIRVPKTDDITPIEEVTATPNDVLAGETFYGNSRIKKVGSLTKQTADVHSENVDQIIDAPEGAVYNKVIVRKKALQQKTISTSAVDRDITPDEGYEGFSSIHAEAVNPSDYYKPEQSKTVDAAVTDVQVLPDAGKVLSSVNIRPVSASIDPNIQPENIKAGTDILGITGSMLAEKDEMERIVTPSVLSQDVLPDDGKVLSKVTVEAVTHTIDAEIQPDNIKLGVNILGVVGNVEPRKAEMTKTANPSTSAQSILPDAGKVLSRVDINPVSASIDPNITPLNIRRGVTVLDVVGNMEADKPNQSKIVDSQEYSQAISADDGYELDVVNIRPINVQPTKEVKSTTEEQIVNSDPNYYIKSVKVKPIDLESKIVTPTSQAQHIEPSVGKDGISDIDVEPVPTESKTVRSSIIEQHITPTTGKFINEVIVEPNQYQSKIVIPSTTSQTITADANKDALLSVQVEGVTNAIDANIQAENIKEGVSILGVAGTLDSSVSGEAIDVATASEMNANLIRENQQKLYRYVGPETSSYITGDLYKVTYMQSGGLDNYIYEHFVNPDDTTATASKVLNDSYFYNAAGQRVQGDMVNAGSASVNINNIDALPISISAAYYNGEGHVDVTAEEKAKFISENIKKDVSLLGITGTYEGEPLQTKTVVPSSIAQSVTPSSGFRGLSRVDVSAIPSNYIIPEGTKVIRMDGTYNVTQKASVDVKVSPDNLSRPAPIRVRFFYRRSTDGKLITDIRYFEKHAAVTMPEVGNIAGSSYCPDLKFMRWSASAPFADLVHDVDVYAVYELDNYTCLEDENLVSLPNTPNVFCMMYIETDASDLVTLHLGGNVRRLNIEIDWGDGMRDLVTQQDGQRGSYQSHTYDTAGSYTITVCCNSHVLPLLYSWESDLSLSLGAVGNSCLISVISKGCSIKSLFICNRFVTAAVVGQPDTITYNETLFDSQEYEKTSVFCATEQIIDVSPIDSVGPYTYSSLMPSTSTTYLLIGTDIYADCCFCARSYFSIDNYSNRDYIIIADSYEENPKWVGYFLNNTIIEKDLSYDAQEMAFRISSGYQKNILFYGDSIHLGDLYTLNPSSSYATLHIYMLNTSHVVNMTSEIVSPGSHGSVYVSYPDIIFHVPESLQAEYEAHSKWSMVNGSRKMCTFNPEKEFIL